MRLGPIYGVCCPPTYQKYLGQASWAESMQIERWFAQRIAYCLRKNRDRENGRKERQQPAIRIRAVGESQEKGQDESDEEENRETKSCEEAGKEKSGVIGCL